MELTRRVSHIYPAMQGAGGKILDLENKETRLHVFTNVFSNEPELEKVYEERFVRKNLPRAIKIVGLFFFMYLMFTGPNLFNLTSSDPVVKRESEKYCLMVFPPLIPIPFLVYISRLDKIKMYYQKIYSLIIICLTFSFLAGGFHSMLNEWFKYIESDIMNLLDIVKFNDDPKVLYKLDPEEESCNCSFWGYGVIEKNARDILSYYLGDVLLPAATMNINMLRLVMIFIVVPLLKIDTPHYTFIVMTVSIIYCIFNELWYPHTDSIQFQVNKTLVFAFSLALAVVMVFRNRDYERILRMDFLHVYSVERAAVKAQEQKEIIAKENEELKQKLAEQQKVNETTFDLDSPVAKILTELKELQLSGIEEHHKLKIGNIVTALSRLDTNLFTPDIKSQMSSQDHVDADTKNWALDVFGGNKYNRHTQRTGTSRTNSLVSRSDVVNRNEVQLIQELSDEDAHLLKDVELKIVQNGWDFDAIEVAHVTNNRPLYFVGLAIFELHDLCAALCINKAKLTNFLMTIDQGYLNNPYHSSTHAADVTNAVNFLISKLSDGHIQTLLTIHEFFASLIAAIIHDFQHPGKSNLFLIKTQHDIAIQYSDSSVLERMHLAESFSIAKDPGCDIFSDLKDKQYREVRKAIIEMVLNTDLSHHFQLVGSIKTASLSNKNEDLANNPMMLMNCVMKTADIGHSSKCIRLHGIWSGMIIEEFFQQGDAERDNALPISPFMDRNAENSAKNQVGFFEFIVLPFFEIVTDVIFPSEFHKILGNVRFNYQLWKQAVGKELTAIEDIKKQFFSEDQP